MGGSEADARAVSRVSSSPSPSRRGGCSALWRPASRRPAMEVGASPRGGPPPGAPLSLLGGLRFLLLKPDDVPTYVEYGVAELGIVGRDVLLEQPYDLYAPVDLGIGRCRMSIAGLPGQPGGSPPPSGGSRGGPGGGASLRWGSLSEAAPSGDQVPTLRAPLLRAAGHPRGDHRRARARWSSLH